MDKLLNKKVVVIDGSLAAELKKFDFDFEVKLLTKQLFI